MRVALAVALGGSLGALLRWLVGLLVLELQRRLAPGAATLPLGTLAVNLVGCLAIGWIAGRLDSGMGWTPVWRAFVVVGVLGGFTTFSSFALEATQLARDGRTGLALVYLLGAPLAGAVGLAVTWTSARW